MTLGAAAMLVACASLSAALMLRPDDSAGPCVVVEGPDNLPELPETSGLAVGRRNPGLLWSHNDSGNAAVLFALDANGRVRGRVRVPARTRDWEDVSAARCPYDCLFIADIGDNRRRRPRVQIYRVPEPAPGDTQTAAPDVFNVTYTDGPHNAEAMFVVGTDLFIITRDRTGGVYLAGMPHDDGHEMTFQRVGELGLDSVTDAETATDGASVVVRTLDEVLVYPTADLIRGSYVPVLRISVNGLREPQGEGVALDGEHLYLSSEGRPWNRSGRLMTLRCTLSS